MRGLAAGGVRVVVDALPGLEPILSLLRAFSRPWDSRGVRNKVVRPMRGSRLPALADNTGHNCAIRPTQLGGARHMIERSSLATGGITSLKRSLSGPCNFVLDECGRGVAREEASASEKRVGCGSGCNQDLPGRAAARKTSHFIARHALSTKWTACGCKFQRGSVEGAVSDYEAAATAIGRHRPVKLIRGVEKKKEKKKKTRATAQLDRREHPPFGDRR